MIDAKEAKQKSEENYKERQIRLLKRAKEEAKDRVEHAVISGRFYTWVSSIIPASNFIELGYRVLSYDKDKSEYKIKWD